PQREGQPQLIRATIANPSLNPILLLRTELPAVPLRPPSTVQLRRSSGRRIELLGQLRAISPSVARDRADLDQRLALAAKGDELLAQLHSRVHRQCPPVALSHERRLSHSRR